MNDHDVDDGEDFDGIEEYDQTIPDTWDDDYDGDPFQEEWYETDDDDQD